MAIPGNFLSAVAETVDPDTSGWTAVLNCTKSLGSGGRVGDGCLALTSVAAGEMQATTTAAYPVAVGSTYETFADTASATEPERIGILWLSASYAAISTTWSPTTTAASGSWHRVSVAGVAPSGAVYARVVLSATATAAAKIHYWENVYFGFPVRTSGNLLSFNTENPQVDASAWAVDTNCAITRDVPVVSWAVDWYYGSGPVIKATTTANGNMAVKTVETPGITPGVEYGGYIYLNPPTSGSAAWVELRWYDASTTLISTKRSALAAPGTGWYRQRVSGVAPAGAATVVMAAGITGATAAQVLRVQGAVLGAPPVIEVGSVVTYEDASFEEGIGQWTVASGVATLARSTPWVSSGVWDGSYSLVATSTTATTSVLVSGRYPITVGQSWRPQVEIKPASTGWQIGLGIRWYDGSGALISTSTSGVDTIPSAAWWTVFADATPPAGAATAAIEVTLTAPSSSSAQLDAVALYPALPAFEVTPHSDLGEVTVTFRELDSGAAFTLYRVVGAAQTVVRGPDGWLQGVVLSSEQMTVEDYEAPLGVPVRYRYSMVSVTTGAATGDGISDEVTLTVSDPSACWVKNPLQPERNVLLRAATAPDWQRPIEQAEYRIRGRRNSVVLSDVRGGLAGTLEVWTDNDDQRQALHFALDTGSVLLIQFAPGLGLEDAYYAVGQAVEGRIVPYGGEPRRRWQLPLTQVDAPIGGVGGTAGWTVQDVISTYDTVQQVFDSYATVLDLVLDNRKV